MFERAKKRRTRWSVVASTRCACLFEIDKKKFQLPPEREGTTARFFPLIHRTRIETEKKRADGAHFRKRPSNARARRPRDARERRIVASVVVVFKAKVVVSPWKPPCSSSIEMCLFKVAHAFVLVRLVFFFAKAQRRDRERERERREAGKTRHKHTCKKTSSSPFFLSILKP